MNRKSIIAGALLIVLATAGVLATTLPDNNSSESSPANSQAQSKESAKSATELKFESYVGEDYDRYFIANMLAHHQGAIDMAKLASANAKHSELKTMANDIINTQSSEVSRMLAYQQAWGYPASSGDMMVDHSSMGMQEEMANMTKQLEGKTGDEFDKAFVSQMIAHHTSAIDMAKPAAKNAYHPEVKALASEIITAQTKEIAQMKQWQKDWGYTNNTN